MKKFHTVAVVVIAVAIISVFIWFLGSTNPETPAGYIGYQTQGAILGKARFYGLQKGPGSPGRTWLLKVVNVSVTPYTYHEKFVDDSSVLSKDNLKISFTTHVVWHVNPDMVKEFVEEYTTLDAKQSPDQIVQVAYDNFLKEPIRTYSRDEVQKYVGLEVKDKIMDIGQAIQERTQKLTSGRPFLVSSIVIGNISYPPAVADAVADKLATTQILEKKKTEIEIGRQEAARRIAEAEGIAKSMDIINQKLTPQYLQHEAIEAQKAMVGSPSHTAIYIPVGPMGVPLVGTFDTSKTDTTKKLEK